jgi:hypothetical protein
MSSLAPLRSYKSFFSPDLLTDGLVDPGTPPLGSLFSDTGFKSPSPSLSQQLRRSTRISAEKPVDVVQESSTKFQKAASKAAMAKADKAHKNARQTPRDQQFILT